MVNRLNPEDIFKIVKEDFSWIEDDIQQHISILKDKMKELIDQDNIQDLDEYKEKYGDLRKIIEKIDEIRSEYISIVKGEELIEVKNETEYDYLEDWTGTDPVEILLFNQNYDVKYWRDIILIILEELYKRDKSIIADIVRSDDIKERTRVPFTYEHNKINKSFYKKTSYGLYVLVNDSANTIYSRCLKVLEFAGFGDVDFKIKLSKNFNNGYIDELRIANNNQDGIIKLSRKYASVSIDKSLFKVLVNSIINRKVEYGTDYIEPRKIEDKYKDLILQNTKYTTPYHVVINIIKFLIDTHFLDNYKDSKKGKYIVVDDVSLNTWLSNNI